MNWYYIFVCIIQDLAASPASTFASSSCSCSGLCSAKAHFGMKQQNNTSHKWFSVCANIDVCRYLHKMTQNCHLDFGLISMKSIFWGFAVLVNEINIWRNSDAKEISLEWSESCLQKGPKSLLSNQEISASQKRESLILWAFLKAEIQAYFLDRGNQDQC